MLSIVKFADVFTDIGAADTGVALHLLSGGKQDEGTLRYSPRARMTDWIWVASSRVGERTRAWVSRWVVLMVCKMEMENVAVFPVPDCAAVSIFTELNTLCD